MASPPASPSFFSRWIDGDPCSFRCLLSTCAHTTRTNQALNTLAAGCVSHSQLVLRSVAAWALGAALAMHMGL